MGIPLWARMMEADFVDCPVSPHPKECIECWWGDWMEFWHQLGLAVNNLF